MKIDGEYVYKKEVDWSLCNWGLTLPIKTQVIFGRIMNRFLSHGEKKDITLYIAGKSYTAKINNINFDKKYKRNDILQIRYGKDVANVLQQCFWKSYNFIKAQHEINKANHIRKWIELPDEYKEYLVIYTTEYDDSYILEPILANELSILRKMIPNQNEHTFESYVNGEVKDPSATYLQSSHITKIRKLNRKISDNLKLLYGYRCQICGKLIGKEYGGHICEAHHIDYFVKSLNNNSSNILIVCPNHHSIIHELNPIFNKKTLIFHYQNGYQEKIALNRHL